MTGLVMVTRGGGCGSGGAKGKMVGAVKRAEEEQQSQIPVVAFLLAALRKSMVSCRVERGCDDVISAVHQMEMEIGWPTNVRHIAHVTFDRFNGFLGLPVEFQLEIPGRVPSASASVFGVSAESMQCSYDSKGNSVPTILLLMQERLFSQRGLKAEGIFRINPENSQEEQVRDQLNRGNVPDDIDVHCLAGLIKAWFRELPSGVLDGLSPEQVLECNTEEECVALVKQLKPTETALLNWAVNLMADVVEEEEFNKMNARNIAMVFAPNMTQMSDPLTALMHAVQVMNLLKTLITKTLRERDETESGGGGYSPMSSCSSDHHTDEDLYSQHEMDTGSEGNGHYSHHNSEDEEEEKEHEDKHDHDDDLYDHDHEDDLYEVEELGEIEESFLRQLDDKKAVTTSFFADDQPSSDLKKENCANPHCCSGMSVTDSNEENSGLTSATIDVEEDEEEGVDSGKSLMVISLEAEATNKVGEDTKKEVNSAKMEDLEMERLLERVSNVPLFASE